MNLSVHTLSQDWSATDLVVKRSTDGGISWSPLRVVYANSTPAALTQVGNAAPVVLPGGRILLPFCVNNSRTWQSYSDDDGESWAEPQDFTPSVALSPPWTWIGLGPPAGLRLASGRLVLPSYVSHTPNDNGDLSSGLLLLSDDEGAHWRIGAQWTFGLAFPNECQAVEVAPNMVMVNSRSLGTQRIQAWSFDGGETIEPNAIAPIKGLVQPLIGCQGSTIADASGALWYSGLDETLPLRYNISVFVARAPHAPGQLQFDAVRVVDAGSAAYSSLALLHDGALGLLYERANSLKIEFEPDQIVFTRV
jgi:sialidase-1